MEAVGVGTPTRYKPGGLTSGVELEVTDMSTIIETDTVITTAAIRVMGA